MQAKVKLQYPLVLIGGGNENWGMFSEAVEDRSVQWGIFENKIKGCGKTPADFRAFMDDPRIVLWVSNQHQARAAVHPKVLSLPLGVKGANTLYGAMERHRHAKKKKLLLRRQTVVKGVPWYCCRRRENMSSM